MKSLIVALMIRLISFNPNRKTTHAQTYTIETSRRACNDRSDQSQPRVFISDAPFISPDFFGGEWTDRPQNRRQKRQRLQGKANDYPEPRGRWSR